MQTAQICTYYHETMNVIDGLGRKAGVVREYHDGWRFLPRISPHKPTRVAHETAAGAIPSWVVTPYKMESRRFSNRETCAVVLCFRNNEVFYKTARKMDSVAIKEFVEDGLFGSFETLDEDLWNMQTAIGSLWRVNWREVADAMHDED